MKIVAVIGGTGKLGTALARRWAKAGCQVIIGARAADSASKAAAEVLTSTLIFINKTYSVDGAGIQITGTLIDPES